MVRKIPVLVMMVLIYTAGTTQSVDSFKIKGRQKMQKPEILNSGFIDVLNNGQVNAAGRFIRLFIGEPGKFKLPIAVYSCVSSNSFQNSQSTNGMMDNKYLNNAFINPLSGLVNISVEDIYIPPKKRESITRAGMIYHFGCRVLTGYKMIVTNNFNTSTPLNFINSYCVSGLYFQTGAWEKNTENLGIFWAAARYIICKSGERTISEFLPQHSSKGFYHGWSAGFGIEINSLVNIKLLYYKYVQGIEERNQASLYQFSFNYMLKN